MVNLICCFFSYDAMDHGRCLDILEDCGVGPRPRRLIQRFWEFGEMACRASGYYRRGFESNRGGFQGGLSSTIFNRYPANVPDIFHKNYGSVEKTANARAASHSR